jgi:aspartyl aminopeptidase
LALAFAIGLLDAVLVTGQDEIPAANSQAVTEFAEQYKTFIGEARTDGTFVEEAIKLAEATGFQAFAGTSGLRPGAKLYFNNRGRTLVLVVVGAEKFREGFRIVGAHVDSPFLELKARPIHHSGQFIQFQTMPHGGLKNYQWVNRPLALIGNVYRKDGSKVAIKVGLHPAEPVFVIPDLAPHVDVSQRERTSRDVVKGEEMDPVVFSANSTAEDDLSAAVRLHLKNVYGLEEDDLVSAELRFVPAEAPRDVGFNRALVGAYGQDDRAGAYTALRAILESAAPRFTSVAFLVNNEEVGSNNNTGAGSSALNDFLADLIYRQEGDAYRDVVARHALRLTYVLSADMNPGLDPTWPETLEADNAPRLGKGLNFKMYGRGNSPNPALTARLRKIFDDEKIPWQVMTYKVGVGGGGTIGGFLSDDNMEVIDVGIPMLSLHSPSEISSKSDLHVLYRAMKAFYDKLQ